MEQVYTQAIYQYHIAVEELKRVGEIKETSTREAFHNLVRNILPKHYKVITEKTSRGQERGNTIYYDLIFGHIGGSPVGYLEDKDPKDNLEKEIQYKRNQGYNFQNLLFQNGNQAVLFQDIKSQSISKTVDMNNTDSLAQLLEQWVNYQDQDMKNFESAYQQFKSSVPILAEEIHRMVEEQYTYNQTFRSEVNLFYQSLQETIGASISLSDVKDIIVQHIMTRDLFQTLLASSFNKFNSISKLIETIISSLGRGFEEKIHHNITPYYETLAHSLQKLHNIHYESEILRTFYEEFYKSYNPKQADTHGIIYTPIDVVNFMITICGSLLQEYFGKTLATKGVQILDPCTGTGTFIAGLIQYFRKGDLSYKYQYDLHANELSILAYYIGSLYIERLYSSLNPEELFQEFKNMCFVDTLDNIYANPNRTSIEGDTLGEEFSNISAMDEENATKVKEQNKQDFLVIIGNPPYNVGQSNENQNNKNRAYQHIDKRIKDTYVKESQAQNKNMLYDMYTRFIRWSTDRIGEEGIVAFITNRSFLDAKGFDGFRKSVAKEFTYIHTIDLGGDIRKGGMGENIFNVMVGVAITFFIKVRQPVKTPGIFYINPFHEHKTRENKLAYLKYLTENYMDRQNIPWKTITPTQQGQWLNISDSDFESLPIELANKKNKSVSGEDFQSTGTTLFGLFSQGLKTNKDSWVYDKNISNLEKKVQYFIDEYNKEVERWNVSDKKQAINDFVKRHIKWSSLLYPRILSLTKYSNINKTSLKMGLYRPFQKMFVLSWDIVLHERRYQMPKIFPTGKQGENLVICFSQSGVKFECMITHAITDYNLLTSGAGPTQCLPLWRYDQAGQKHSNINAKMLQSWHEPIGFVPTPEQAFYYVYAVLHHSEYREKYKMDLTQNFPRLPLLKNDFLLLSTLGEKLAFDHLYYEQLDPYSSITIEEMDTKPFPMVKLRSYPSEGKIVIDDNTHITGIPKKAWDYKLGNRSAIDWVLEGYKEKKISPDNGDISDVTSPLYTEYGYKAYRFHDYKKECLNIIPKIITMSLESLQIIQEIITYSLQS